MFKCLSKITYVSKYLNILLNLFFRHNNLLVAFIDARVNNNKLIIGEGTVLKYCKFSIHGKGNVIKIGNNCILSGVVIYMNSGGNKLQIGNGTIVNANEKQRTRFDPCDGSSIVIGEYCLFSNNIELHTTDYHKIFFDGDWTNRPQDILIGSHCWIGLNSIILKGSILPNDVVVGAKSLVNKRFDDTNIIIAGNPAKIIRRDVTWNI